MSNIFEECPSITNNLVFNVTYTLNKGTGVYSMTVTNIDVIFDYLLPLFENTSFYTRKILDYHYWAISTIMHKFGYYYLPEGKKIALQISKGTNKYRYSNSKNLSISDLPDKESISKLLAQTPPFDVYSGKSHLNLAK